MIPFRNGVSISDSQLKPRMYKTVQAFERAFPKHYLGTDGVELVEYAPVVRCKDCKHWDVDPDTYGDAFGPKGCCFGICDGANTTGQNDFCSQGERIDRNG